MTVVTRTAGAPRIKNDELRRERLALIVSVARELFRTRGYHGSSVRDIGEAAGLTQGTLYNYIRSKEEVLFLICDDLMTGLQGALNPEENPDAALPDGHPPGGALEAMVDAVLAIVAQRQDDIILIYQETHALSPDMRRRVMRRGHDFIETATRQLQIIRGEDPSHPPSKAIALDANIATFLPFMIALRRWELSHSLTLEEQTAGIKAFLIKALSH